MHLDNVDVLIVTVCVGLSNFVWLPIMGAVSDRYGRTRILVIFTVLTILTAYPAMVWLTEKSILQQSSDRGVVAILPVR